MTPEEVPIALAAPAAMALARDADESDDIFTDPGWDGMRSTYEDRARDALAAALSVCEAHSEWQVTTATHVYQWRRYGFPLPQAEGMKRTERRWVFTTPAEPVPDGEAK